MASNGAVPEGRVRILATDDRAEVLRLVDRALGERYECEFASDVPEARSKLAGGRFDLALCDIQMPGESGLVLAEEIAAEHPETAVVLVTGVDDPEVADRAFALGVCGYLVKPFWPGQLTITVINALRRHELELAQEAHAQALEDRIKTLMDAAPVPIFIKDRERRYTIANLRAHAMVGLGPDELVGRTDADILTPEGEQVAAASDRLILEHGETWTGEETVSVGGEKKTFLMVKFPYLDDAGQIAGISGIAADVTDRRHAEELRKDLASTQRRAIEELRASRQETVERLTRAIEMHDVDTGRHVNRMAAVATFLAVKLGLPPERVALLRTAAPMHDVGKVATPDRILRKEGPLTPEERATMEQHTLVGYRILSGSKSELLQLAARIALTHHERWDGDGYPNGLRGEEIPIEGRVVAVADVLDALLSDRCYRKALPATEAMGMITEERGTHFDPRVVDALLDDVEAALAVRR